MNGLFGSLTGSMGTAYPELIEREAAIKDILYQEEEIFLKTLDRGNSMLEEFFSEKSQIKRVLPADLIFKLHDTHGFPMDLTEIIAKERGFSVDKEGFQGY